MYLPKRILSLIYSFVSSLYHLSYDLGIRRAYRPKIKTIVIGNLTWGGTGKTPVVADVVRHYLSQGKKVAIVSRSYKGRMVAPALVDTAKSSASIWGDEAFLLKKLFPEVSVVVGQRKVECVKWVEKNVPCDVIVVDDGLQHRALDGHFYITLFDTSVPKLEYRWAPLGKMREMWSGVNRTNVVIFTKTNLANPQTYQYLLHKVAGVPSYDLSYDVSQISDIHGETVVQKISDPAVLVSGLGNPTSFELLMEKVLQHKNFTVRFFPDHHDYVQEEIDEIERAAKDKSLIYTTAKDAVKIEKLKTSGAWRRVGLAILIKGKEKLHAQLDEVLRTTDI